MADNSDASTTAETPEEQPSASYQLRLPFQKLDVLFDELLEKQNGLVTKLESINGQLACDETVQKVHVTMLHTHQYYKKLLQIKKDMMDIHSKAAKLKTRAQKLYQKQEEDARLRMVQKQHQEAYDRSIIAKPAARENS